VRRASRLPPEQLAPYLLQVPSTPAPLQWRGVFGNDNPVEVEVGFGKGLFLLTAATACPDVNFVGLEILRKYQLFTATRLAKRTLTNVRVACTDARGFLRDHVGPASLQALHVYFPDPWWKNRHQKRRVFTREFVAECQRTLRVGGHLYVVTDVADYFQIITELVAQRPGLQLLPPLELKEPKHDLDYLTNFERKYRKEGRPIHRANYARVESPSG
jgi:tRNA (guanine-N7-)-methyltransferase